MNYIEIINNFWTKFRECPLSSSAVAVYFYLLDQCNREHWRMPIRCMTVSICANLAIDKSTFTRARMKLRERGLIIFREGRRNICAPTYSIPCDATSRATSAATIYKKENINSTTTMMTPEELMLDKEKEWFEEILNNEGDKETLAMDFNISIEKVNQLLKKFKADVDFTQVKHSNRVAFRQHVKRWMNRHIEINNNKHQEYDQTNRAGSAATNTYEKRREAAENLVKELGNRPDLGTQIW